jgi:cysteine desulfurase
LLCVSATDSELGAIQPTEEIAKIVASSPNCHLHIDAAQAVGKIPIALEGADTFCFSPHKFYGIGGFGVLVKRRGVVLEPLIHGGSEASGLLYRGGTPSPAMASACFVALRKALQNQSENFLHVTNLRNYLSENLPVTMRINTPPDGNPYILNLSASNTKGKDVQAAFNQRGIAVSVKSACSTDNAPSRAVFAVSGNKKNALNSWRVSFGIHTTKNEIDTLINAIHQLIV